MPGERVGMAAPWRWLAQSAAALRAYPRGGFGGASVLAALALLPGILAQLLALVLPTMLAQVLGLLATLLLFPPAVGGYFRLLHAQASGERPLPAALFAIFGDGRATRRLVLANLILACATLLLLDLLAFALAGEPLLHYFDQLSQLKPGTTQLPPAPAGMLGFALALGFLCVLSLSVQLLAFAEIALGTRSTLPAIAASLSAHWRNLVVLLPFYAASLFFAFLAFMLAVLVVVLVASVVAALSSALGQIFALVCLLLLVVAAYALLIGFFYFAWRELFDLPPPPSAPVHRIAA